MEISMFPELFMPIAYISVVGLLVLRDEYQSRQLNRERLEARAQVEWPVTIETISGPMYGHTDNTSATGALLVCLQPLYKGEIVKVVLNAPSRSLEVEAEVVWTDRYLPSEKYYPRNAIAVQFKWISDESRNFLMMVVHDYLKKAEN
jgi:hypothetical protein